MKAKSSFIQRLRRDPDLREEVRRLILTDELLALPARVESLRAEMHEEFRRVWEVIGQLAEAQRRTEVRLESLAARVEELAEAQRRTEVRVEELAEAQRRTEVRVEELAEAQRRTEVRVEELAEAQKRTEAQVALLRKDLGRLANIVGMSVEEEAGDVAGGVFRRRGFALLEGPWAIELDGDLDVVFRVQRDDEAPFYVLIEAKLRLHEADVRKWSEKLGDPAFQERLRAQGIEGRAVPYAYGMRVYKGAVEAGIDLGIGIMGPDGELAAPKKFIDIG
ncbi:hypothetical protein HRbin11_01603 [bacterium HR11]|nr:hypothetical protein HRbin11_01603 [bacterium HR11]